MVSIPRSAYRWWNREMGFRYNHFPYPICERRTTPTMTIEIGEFRPPARLLLGPGPSMVHSDVLRAMSTPLLGHLDPAFLTIMDEIQALLRCVFQTDHPFTIAVPGTGSAGMEAALVNVIEPG